MSFILVCLLFNLFCTLTVKANPEKRARFAAKVKSAIAGLGTGEQGCVSVRPRDKTKIKCYVEEAGEDSFTVVDAKTVVVTKVTYAQVKQVKGKNNGTGKDIAIIAAGMAVFFLAVLAELRN